jgi:pimeloyl-ACP methyl ester carboxylesterase
MPVIRIGRQRLSYDDTGGSAPAVVFSHGFGTNRSIFAPQLGALRKTYRCITWDQRAHGESYTDGPFTFWDSAEDCLTLLDQLGIKTASFVGASQGGFVSLRIALMAPNRVRSLVVLGSSAAVETPAKKASYQQMNGVLSAAGAAGPPEPLLDAFSAICFGSKIDPDPWKKVWREWPLQQATLALQALADRDDLLGRLKEIRAPALVLHGTADNSYETSHGQAIAEGLANSEDLLLIEGGAHFLNMTDPKPVNTALSRFLKLHA